MLQNNFSAIFNTNIIHSTCYIVNTVGYVCQKTKRVYRSAATIDYEVSYFYSKAFSAFVWTIDELQPMLIVFKQIII